MLNSASLHRFRQTYYSIVRERLYEDLMKLAVPKKLVGLVKMTTKRAAAGVKVQASGCDRGDPLAATLFSFELESASGCIRTNPGRTICNRLTPLIRRVRGHHGKN
ncbi:Reverse transcriptase (RNA-dependent DNA polymerase) [Nesidiocoris tenuis]|uniref:Reverse transcriptase (RNA-dependent DNA polymerase) n=1 Tax=Nesidiocoris tenuis TaxID=355587 RepID=A0ABN7AHP8_9HEMI|nr:Reverse transcriptase (RNA-dependent DNA polymerase) [Nesidiocoris tenuis]